MRDKLCPRCRKNRIKGPFKHCWTCNQELLYGKHIQQTNELDINETECDMCGKEGATLRKDGKYYCSRCWQEWNG